MSATHTTETPAQRAHAVLDSYDPSEVIDQLHWTDTPPEWFRAVAEAFGGEDSISLSRSFVEGFVSMWAIRTLRRDLDAARAQMAEQASLAAPGHGLAGEIAALARRVADLEADEIPAAASIDDGRLGVLRDALYEQRARWGVRPSDPEHFDRMSAEAVAAIDAALTEAGAALPAVEAEAGDSQEPSSEVGDFAAFAAMQPDVPEQL